MEGSKYPYMSLSVKEAIEKQDFTSFFKSKEEMMKAIAYKGCLCSIDSSFASVADFDRIYKGDAFSYCFGVKCKDCLFNVGKNEQREKIFTKNLQDLEVTESREVMKQVTIEEFELPKSSFSFLLKNKEDYEMCMLVAEKFKVNWNGMQSPREYKTTREFPYYTEFTYNKGYKSKYYITNSTKPTYSVVKLPIKQVTLPTHFIFKITNKEEEELCLDMCESNNFLWGTNEPPRPNPNTHSFPYGIRVTNGRMSYGGFAHYENYKNSDYKEYSIISLTREQQTNKQQTIMATTIKTTRKGMETLYNAACSTWKTNIQALTTKYASTFSDEVTLPVEEIEKMYEASNSTQIEVLDKVFPTYKTSISTNPFVNTFEAKELSDLSAKLFGRNDKYELQIATDAAREINRKDLVGKALFTTYKVIVHEVPAGNSVIEFVKK